MAYIEGSSGDLLSNAKSESFGGLIDTARSVIQATKVVAPLTRSDTIVTAVAHAEELLGVEIELWQRSSDS